MSKIEIWNLILSNLYNKYSNNPDDLIVQRLTDEQELLDDDIIEYFVRLNDVYQDALSNNNERIEPSHYACSTFVTYLLGLSKINPLPPHYYCSNCKKVEFIDYNNAVNSCLYDFEQVKKCECGSVMKIDGHDIPCEVITRYVSTIKEKVEIPFKYKEFTEEYKRKFLAFPFLKASQACYLLESITGINNDSINLNDEVVKQRIINGDFKCRSNKTIDFFNKVYKIIKPNSYNEFLKILEFGYSIDGWNNNGEILVSKEGVKLSQIPLTCEDVYNLLYNKMCKQSTNIYDNAKDKAITIAKRVSKGYYTKNGMDSCTQELIKSLNFDYWFENYLSKVFYLPSKAMAIMELKYIILLTWYDTFYKEEFDKVALKINL